MAIIGYCICLAIFVPSVTTLMEQDPTISQLFAVGVNAWKYQPAHVFFFSGPGSVVMLHRAATLGNNLNLPTADEALTAATVFLPLGGSI